MGVIQAVDSVLILPKFSLQMAGPKGLGISIGGEPVTPRRWACQSPLTTTATDTALIDNTRYGYGWQFQEEMGQLESSPSRGAEGA